MLSDADVPGIGGFRIPLDEFEALLSMRVGEYASALGHTHVEADVTDLDKYTQAEVDALIGLTLIQRQVVASPVASVDFTSGLDDTYDQYLFTALNLLPASNADLWVRTSTDGGSTFDTTSTAYRWGAHGMDVDATPAHWTDGAQQDGKVVLGNTVKPVGSNLNGISLNLWFPNPEGTTRRAFWFAGVYSNSIGEVETFTGAGQKTASADVDAIRFLFSTGNIASGSIALYGLVK